MSAVVLLSAIAAYHFARSCNDMITMVTSISVSFWLALVALVGTGLVAASILGRQNGLSRWTTFTLLAALSITYAVCYNAGRMTDLGSGQWHERGWAEFEITAQALAVGLGSLLGSVPLTILIVARCPTALVAPRPRSPR